MSLGPVLGSVASQGGFNPETDTDTVVAGYWAEASVWTPPAEGGEVTSLTNWSDYSYALPLLKTGSAGPTYTAASANLNNRPAWQFVISSGKYLEVNYLVWNSVVGGAVSHPHTLITVFYIPDLTYTHYLHDGDGTAYRRSMLLYATSGDLRQFAGAAADVTLSGGLTGATPYLLIASYTDPSVVRLIGGGADQSAADTSGVPHQMIGMHLGSNNLGTTASSFNGDVALHMVCDDVPANLTWLDDLIAWAKTYYAIDGG